MNNFKILIAILSIACFAIIGIILILLISEYKKGNEGYGILITAIWSFALYSIIVLGLISLITDLFSKRKILQKSTWILLGYSLITFLGTMIYEYDFIINWLLLITCSSAIYLTIKEVTQSRKEIMM